MRFSRMVQAQVEMTFFLFFCQSYHKAIHFCEVVARWRHIDMFHLMVISASTRDAVERYRSYDADDCDITVYVSKAKMSMAEFDAAKKHQQEKVKEANEKQDKLDAEIWWKENRAKLEHLDAGKCYEHLKNQEVRPTVRNKLHTM